MNDTTFSEPESILKQVPLWRGNVVADIGSGTGIYSLLASSRVGEEGVVYAIEVQLSYIDMFKKEVDRKGIRNIHVIWADAELPLGTKLENASTDVVLLTNVLFTIDDKEGLVKEIARIAKPGARVLIVDWSQSFSGIGPSSDRISTPKQVRDLFTVAGFSFEKTVDAGSHHYGMIMNKI